MTLDQLLILDQIVKTGSMSAAAKALYRTQPTLSVAMKKLEEEFELEIFSRESYRMTLTPVGEALYQKAQRILSQTKELENLGKQLAMGVEPQLGFALFAFVPLPPLLRILRTCQEEFPQTRLELYSEYMLGSLELLLDGTADIAVIPWTKEHTNLDSIPYDIFEVIPVIASHLPPAQTEEEISQEEMQDYVQIIVGGKNQQKKASFGVLGGRQWRVNDLHTKKEIILAGMGWGGLPKYLIEKELEAGDLTPLKIKNYHRFGTIELRVARVSGKPLGPVAQHLWDRFLQDSPLQKHSPK